MNILDNITAYWWLLAAFPLVGVAIVAYRLFGWRGLLAVATLGAAGFLYKKGATDAQLAAAAKAERQRTEAIETRKGVDDEVSSLTPDKRRDALHKWVRD